MLPQEVLGEHLQPPARESLTRFTWAAAALGPEEVEIAVSHCGICFSDIHLIDNDWSKSVYPFVPGHEIVGTVAAVGSAVRSLAVGHMAIEHVAIALRGWLENGQRRALHDDPCRPR